MPGHSYAVRKVICSPHSGNLVASCSYDMTVCLWDIKSAGEPLLQVRRPPLLLHPLPSLFRRETLIITHNRVEAP